MRVFIGGHRIHHGLVGLVGLALVVHDRKDWRVWFSDFVRAQ